MKNLKGSRTLINLANAFAGESQTRNKYTFFAQTALVEGHKKIEAVFNEVAENERAHAKVFYDLLINGFGHEFINIDSTYPIGYGKTLDNLKYASEGERNEWESVYPEFSTIATEEGFFEAASAFTHIAEIEKLHEARFKDLYNEMKNDLLYKSNEVISWRCRNCGYILEGIEAPASCPSCHHPKGFFEKVL